MSRAYRFLPLLWVGLLGGAAPLPLKTPAVSDEFVVRSWDADDGLPGNVISGIAQTADGYLWLSTMKGLARFDGVRFSVFSSEDAPGLDQPQAAVFAARDGALWVGLAGQGVIRRKGDRFEMVIPRQSSGWITSFAQTADGAVWGGFGPDLKAFRWINGKLSYFSGKEGIRSGIATFVNATRDGELWLSTSSSRGVFEGRGFRSIDPGQLAVTILAPARHGGMWAAQGDQLLHYRANGGKEVLADIGWLGGARAMSVVYEDRAGSLRLGTRNYGLLKFHDGTFERVPISHTDAMSIAEDSDGNLWVGTRGGGVNRLRQRNLFLKRQTDGMLSEVIASVAVDAEGRLWVVGLDGQPVRAVDSSNSFFAPVPGWPPGNAFVVCAGLAGDMWLGVNNGLIHWRDGAFTHESPSESVASLHLDRHGDLWVATIQGRLYQHRDGLDSAMPTGGGLVEVRAMGEDSGGAMWFGTEGGLVFRREEGRIVPVSLPGAKAGEPVRFIEPDGKDTVWIGTLSGGLYRCRGGKVVRLPQETGLPMSDLRSLAIGPDGSFWFGTSSGLFRVAGEEIEAVLDGRQHALQVQNYGRNDGLPSLEFSYGFRNATARTRDGQLCFATSRGMLEITPPPSPEASRPPASVLIEDIQVGGVPVPMADSSQTVALPPRPRTVQIRYTLPQLSTPEEVRFRYRLEGYNDDWVPADTQREASFMNLPPGSYRFVVQAAEAGGAWLPGHASLAITVRAAWWQTGWVRAGAMAGIVLALAALVRWIVLRRVRTRMRALEQQHAVERERTRIARDVHDELGAGLTQISIASQLAKLDPPEATAGHIDEITAITRRVVTSLDEIVWAVNPRNDTLDALLAYLGQYALDFLSPAGVACEVEIPDQTPALLLSAQVRHHLFLVVKEALTNIVKHSGARRVSMKVEVVGGRLLVDIADNGHGFAQGEECSGANGLRNMRERMFEAGGECRIESRPGRETRIVLELPLSRGGA